MKKVLSSVALGIAFVLGARAAHAGAVLSGNGTQRFPATVEVTTRVRAQVETTSIVFAFGPVEAGDWVLTVPSPPGATAVGVDVDRGGGFGPAPMVGEAPPPSLGGSSEATDPAVAAWLGTAPLRADLVGLAAGELTVRVRFQRLLRRYRGEVAFGAGVTRSPLRRADDPGPEVSVTVDLTTWRARTRLDVTGADEVLEDSPTHATIRAGGEVSIRYAEESSGIGIHFLAHRTPTADPLGGQDGYFLLVVDAEDASPDSAQPRTLCLVIDESGSMDGPKIAQARDAARAMLEHLGPLDRFDVIAFDDEVRSFRGAPVLASAENLAAARAFIDGIDADGSTDLDSAIRAGLGGIGDSEPDRFDALILLSDGMATAGETNDVRIHDAALAANRAKTRIFTFSIGGDADLPLMEALARSNRGRHVHLNDAQATSEVAARVRELFEDIRVPRLTDLEVAALGLGANDVLPEQMMDLFSGGQAILVGRYATPAAATVRVTGLDGASAFGRDLAVDAPALAEDDEDVKYVWASEKVGALLADMSRGGDASALQAEIVELGLAYRMQTPYTSFSTAGWQPPGTGGGGSGGGGGSYGGGGDGAGAVGPVELLAALALGAAALRRRRRRP
jgi:Ca-activated chloride channel homolog